VPAAAASGGAPARDAAASACGTRTLYAAAYADPLRPTDTRTRMPQARTYPPEPPCQGTHQPWAQALNPGRSR
jgi:hypothetical protein